MEGRVGGKRFRIRRFVDQGGNRRRIVTRDEGEGVAALLNELVGQGINADVAVARLTDLAFRADSSTRLGDGPNYYQVDGWARRHVATMLTTAKARAKKAGIEFTITEADVRIPALCPALGIPLVEPQPGLGRQDGSPSLDRIDCSLGYVPGNVVVISWRANRIKSNATPDELRKIAEWFDFADLYLRGRSAAVSSPRNDSGNPAGSESDPESTS